MSSQRQQGLELQLARTLHIASFAFGHAWSQLEDAVTREQRCAGSRAAGSAESAARASRVGCRAKRAMIKLFGCLINLENRASETVDVARRTSQPGVESSQRVSACQRSATQL